MLTHNVYTKTKQNKVTKYTWRAHTTRCLPSLYNVHVGQNFHIQFYQNLQTCWKMTCIKTCLFSEHYNVDISENSVACDSCLSYFYKLDRKGKSQYTLYMITSIPYTQQCHLLTRSRNLRPPSTSTTNYLYPNQRPVLLVSLVGSAHYLLQRCYDHKDKQSDVLFESLLYLI